MSDGPTTLSIVPRGASNSFGEHRVLDVTPDSRSPRPDPTSATS